FGGNPVSTAAALAVFDVIEQEDVIGNAQRIGRYLASRIGDWPERYGVVGEVRGRGAMWGVEFVQPGTKKPNPEALQAVLRHATSHGVLPLDAGSWDSVMRIMPPVVISEELLDDAANVIEEALASLG